MRKFLLLTLFISTLVACSVDNDELITEDEFSALNAQAEECNSIAGDDKLAVYTNDYIRDRVDDFGQVKHLYLELLNEGVSREGTFSPPLLNVFRKYNRNNIGDFTTTYVVEEGGCTDSAELTLAICEEIFDAGSDNTVTYTEAEIAQRVKGPTSAEKIFLDALDEGVDRSGTLSKSGEEIIRQYSARGADTYINTYSLGEGNCGDTAVITVIITEE